MRLVILRSFVTKIFWISPYISVYGGSRVPGVARKHPRCSPMMELEVPEQRWLAQLPLAAPGGPLTPLDGLRKSRPIYMVHMVLSKKSS